MNTDPRLQGLVQQLCADARTQPTLAELAADANDLEPTDDEIVEVIMETFGMTRDDVLTRLEGLDIANMWVLL